MDGAKAYRPQKHVCRFGVVKLEVPEVVVSRLGLGHLVVWLGLAGVDNVWKFDGILDEEDGYVVADEVPVPLFGVELDGETTHVARGVHAAPAS